MEVGTTEAALMCAMKKNQNVVMQQSIHTAVSENVQQAVETKMLGRHQLVDITQQTTAEEECLVLRTTQERKQQKSSSTKAATPPTPSLLLLAVAVVFSLL